MGINMKEIKNGHWEALTKESMVELVRRIVENSDWIALRVLLDTRRLFRLKDKPPLSLPEFLLELRDRLAPLKECHIYELEMADCAYDLTISKYSNVPNPPTKKSGSGNYSLKGTGVDCRHYYRAFLRSMQRTIDKGIITNQPQEESEAGRILQNMVYKNFLWSIRECRRETEFSIRYTWKVKGTKYYLWYPSYMTAKEFREWLEENVKDVNPEAPNEQKRIQSLIDANLKRGYRISLDNACIDKISSRDAELSSVEFCEGFKFTGSLADSVAQKKVEEIDSLRPAIKKLGGERLKRLILKIFFAVAEGEYQASRIAEQYGISKASLTRFAGSKWFEKIEDNESVTVPDLWKNTAQILSGNPDFMEIVLTSGIVSRFKEVLRLIDTNRGKKNG